MLDSTGQLCAPEPLSTRLTWFGMMEQSDPRGIVALEECVDISTLAAYLEADYRISEETASELLVGADTNPSNPAKALKDVLVGVFALVPALPA